MIRPGPPVDHQLRKAHPLHTQSPNGKLSANRGNSGNGSSWRMCGSSRSEDRERPCQGRRETRYRVQAGPGPFPRRRPERRPRVYGMTVSVQGLIPYVDPAFRLFGHAVGVQFRSRHNTGHDCRTQVCQLKYDYRICQRHARGRPASRQHVAGSNQKF